MNTMISRRKLIVSAAMAALATPAIIRSAQAAPTPIRFGNAGAVGSGCIETLIFSPTMQKEVLPGFGRFGKDYTFSIVMTKGSPEVVTLLAAEQIDVGTLSFAALASTVSKDLVPGGVKVIADSYQDGSPNGFSNTFAVLEDSPIRDIQDLRGKRIASNGFGTAADTLMRVSLSRSGIDPKKDLEVLEIGFANMGAALRQGRIDCGCMVQPFWAVEQAKGGMRKLFDQREIIGPVAMLFHVAPASFLASNGPAVRAFLQDYYDGLKWLYDPANREMALQIGADVTKSPIDTLRPYFLTEHDFYHAPNGCLTADLIQKPIDAQVEAGMIPATIDAAAVLDMSYLPGSCA